MFENKTLLITGGTGSFGGTVLDHFLSTDIAEIRIFLVTKRKQDDMRHDYQAISGVKWKDKVLYWRCTQLAIC